MGLFSNRAIIGASAAGAYEIKKSLRFNDGDSPELSRTPGSAGNRRTYTISVWVKIGLNGNYRAIIGAGGGSTRDRLQIFNDDKLVFNLNDGTDAYLRTDRLLRDPSAWYHLVVGVDTTQGSASNRIKLYVNGVQETSFTNETYPSQDYDCRLNNNIETFIGQSSSDNLYFDGYIAEFNFIDGTQLTPSSFGETNEDTGQWIPKKYAGSYGSQGWYLNFSDNSGTTATTLGKDSSGNGNNWTPANLSVTAGTGNDSLEDTPTNNFPTLNPINNPVNSTLAEGNLRMSGTDNFAAATFLLPKSGKWYVECSKYGDTKTQSVSVTRAGTAMTNYNGYLGLADNVEYVSNGELGNRTRGDTSDATAWSSDADALIGIAVDMDNGAVYFAHDNTWQNSGNPTSGASKTGAVATDLLTDNNGEHFIAVHGYNGGSTYGMYVNFGQRAFTYSPPTGYVKLCTANLSEPTILKGTDYFNTVLYTGNGSSTLNSITGVGFQPNFVWGKSRNDTQDHVVFDSVRGDDKQIELNNNAAETVRGSAAYRFLSDGFAVSNVGNMNNNSINYVAYNFKEAASAGFDIVAYTGTGSATTVSHSLGVVPEFIFVKNRTDGASVPVSISGLIGTGSDTLYWGNKNSAASSQTSVFPATLPTSSVFSVGTHAESNASSKNYIAYLWTSVEGYSKIGTYTGNGNSNGPFIHTGFKPAFLLIKSTSNAENWNIFDAARDPDNYVHHMVVGNASTEENNSTTARRLDFVSNGIKMRGTDGTINTNGYTYLFMAFAKRPFKYANAR